MERFVGSLSSPLRGRHKAYNIDLFDEPYRTLESGVAMIEGIRAVEGKSDIYLAIKEIPGESSDPLDHQNEIDVVQFEFYGFQIGSSGKGGGSGASKATLTALICQCPASKAGPKLFLACAKGDRLEYAYLSFCQAGTGKQFMSIKVSPAVIIHYGQSLAELADGTQGIIDAVGINFAEIEVNYRPTGPDGNLGGPLTFAFDTTGKK